jgi:hypothetical protein
MPRILRAIRNRFVAHKYIFQGVLPANYWKNPGEGRIQAKGYVWQVVCALIPEVRRSVPGRECIEEWSLPVSPTLQCIFTLLNTAANKSNLGIVHDKKESQSSSLYLAGCYSIDDEGLSMALAWGLSRQIRMKQQKKRTSVAISLRALENNAIARGDLAKEGGSIGAVFTPPEID